MALKKLESVTLELDLNDPKVRRKLARMGKSMEIWREKLEKGRRRARAMLLSNLYNYRVR